METIQELTEWAAGKMGWELETHPTGCRDTATPKHDAMRIWMKVGVFQYFYKDYAPLTKIEQALELAFNQRVSVYFEYCSDGLLLSIMTDEAEPGEPYLLNEWLSKDFSLRDCARQIVTTLFDTEEVSND